MTKMPLKIFALKNEHPWSCKKCSFARYCLSYTNKSLIINKNILKPKQTICVLSEIQKTEHIKYHLVEIKYTFSLYVYISLIKREKIPIQLFYVQTATVLINIFILLKNVFLINTQFVYCLIKCHIPRISLFEFIECVQDTQL